jgi:hypothetical protein
VYLGSCSTLATNSVGVIFIDTGFTLDFLLSNVKAVTILYRVAIDYLLQQRDLNVINATIKLRILRRNYKLIERLLTMPRGRNRFRLKRYYENRKRRALA